MLKTTVARIAPGVAGAGEERIPGVAGAGDERVNPGVAGAGEERRGFMRDTVRRTGIYHNSKDLRHNIKDNKFELEENRAEQCLVTDRTPASMEGEVGISGSILGEGKTPSRQPSVLVTPSMRPPRGFSRSHL